MSLICLMGMSAAGKNVIQSELSKRFNIPICVSHTSRKQRQGEIEGRDYYFISLDEFINKLNNDDFLETRKYNTQFGVWLYGLSKQEVDLSKNQLVILDEKGYFEVKNKLGSENIIPLYIYVDEIVRINRALAREKRTDKNYYLETYRRSVADLKDFERVESDNNVIKINNLILEDAVNEIIIHLKRKGVIS